MKLTHRWLKWLDGLKQYHDPNWRIGPDACRHCNVQPFPAGQCKVCGWTRPIEKKHKVFSDNNVPAMAFVAVVWIFVLSLLFALLFRYLLA